MNNDPLVVPDYLKALIQPLHDIVRLADQQYAAKENFDYGAFEEEVAQRVQAIERGVHEHVLGQLDVDSQYIRVWGSAYKQVGRYDGNYQTMAGPVRVKRSIYRKVGERNGRTVDPVSLRAGVVEDGWLPRTAQAMAYLLSQGTSREAEGTSEQLARLPYSRSSFERVGHAVGALYTSASATIEQGLIDAYNVPAEARSISVSIDRVSLPMEEKPIPVPPRNPELTRQIEAMAAAGKRQFDVDPRTQASIEQQLAAAKAHVVKVERNWRMAYCATVTLHDGAGDAIHTIRYGRMPQGDVRSLMRGLARDIRALLAKRRDLRLVYLADGAVELWGLFDSYLPEREVGATAVRLVDCWHVLEYLGAAARLMEWKHKAEPGLFKRWKTMLLERPRGRDTILEELRRSGLQNFSDRDGKRAVGDAIRYIERRLAQMRFAAARRLCLPIGSGQVEATCKSLVALRMKRPGARWKKDTGEEVLQLRALTLSDRWRPAIERSMHRLRKTVKVLDRRNLKAA